MAVSVLEKYHFRKMRVRRRITGTADRPRLSVCRSSRHIYAQLIDDNKGHTLAFASTREPEFRKQKRACGNKAAAFEVGKLVAERAKKKKIQSVVFDRGGRIFHGRVKSVADGAREGGLLF